MFAKAKDQFSGVDLVVNNAGIIHEKSWEKMIEINLVCKLEYTECGYRRVCVWNYSVFSPDDEYCLDIPTCSADYNTVCIDPLINVSKYQTKQFNE